MNGAAAFPLSARPAPPGWRWRHRLRRGGWALAWAVGLAAALHPFHRLAVEYQPRPAAPAPRAEPVPAVSASGGRRPPVAEASGGVSSAPDDVVRRSTLVVRRAAPPPSAPTDPAGRLAAAGRWAEAVDGYRRTLERRPTWTDGWAGLAVALVASGREAEARAAWRRLRRLAPLDRRAAAGLALADTPERAERRLRALLREGREPWLLAALGRLRLAGGDRAGALAAYREALDGAPGEARLRRVVADLEGRGG